MTTIQDIDDALHQFDEARLLALARLSQAYDALRALDEVIGIKRDQPRLVEPLHYVQEDDKGGFDLCDGEFGLIINMDGFALYNTEDKGELAEGRERTDALRLICSYILRYGKSLRSSALAKEAKSLLGLIGTIDDPMDFVTVTKPKREWQAYADDSTFFEFLDREFNHTATYATMEELAKFAFGDVEAAMLAYDQYISDEDDSSSEDDE